jgi:hypothetical protein
MKVSSIKNFKPLFFDKKINETVILIRFEITPYSKDKYGRIF